MGIKAGLWVCAIQFVRHCPWLLCFCWRSTLQRWPNHLQMRLSSYYRRRSAAFAWSGVRPSDNTRPGRSTRASSRWSEAGSGSPVFAAEAEYVSSENSRLLVEVVRFPRDSDAYSLLTIVARSARDPRSPELGQITREVGTASVILPGRIAFFKGTTFVRVTAREPAAQDPNNLAYASASLLGPNRKRGG